MQSEKAWMLFQVREARLRKEQAWMLATVVAESYPPHVCFLHFVCLFQNNSMLSSAQASMPSTQPPSMFKIH